MKKLMVCLMVVSVSMFSLSGCGKKEEKKPAAAKKTDAKKTP